MTCLTGFQAELDLAKGCGYSLITINISGTVSMYQLLPSHRRSWPTVEKEGGEWAGSLSGLGVRLCMVVALGWLVLLGEPKQWYCH